jgi:hypothetical protein
VVVVTNGGTTAAAGTANISVVASADGTVDAADQPIGAATKRLTLKPGKSKTLKIKITFPAPAADGDYQLLAAATFDGAAAGTVSAATLRIERPRVDLAGLAGSGGGESLALGGKAKVPLPLTNRGNVPAKGAGTVDLILSTDGTTDPAKSSTLTTLGNVKVSAKPGQTRTLTLKFAVPPTLPAPFTAGSYQLLVRFTGVGDLATLDVSSGGILATLPVTVE